MDYPEASRELKATSAFAHRTYRSRLSGGGRKTPGESPAPLPGPRQTGHHLPGGHHGPGVRLARGPDPGRPHLRPRHAGLRLGPGAPPRSGNRQIFCEVGFHQELGAAQREVENLPRFAPQEIAALYLGPPGTPGPGPRRGGGLRQPGPTHAPHPGGRLQPGGARQGEFGGKMECSSYLIGPHRTGEFRVVIPGMGDRIFSMTQDDEMVVAFPGRFLAGHPDGHDRGRQKDRRPLPHHLLPEFPAGIPQTLPGPGQEMGNFVNSCGGGGSGPVGHALPRPSPGPGGHSGGCGRGLFSGPPVGLEGDHGVPPWPESRAGAEPAPGAPDPVPRIWRGMPPGFGVRVGDSNHQIV